VVTVLDVTPIAMCNGEDVSEHPEDAHIDGNGDGVIDLLDAFIMVLHFGESAT